MIIKHVQNTSTSDLCQLLDTLKKQLSDITDIVTFDHALSYIAHYSAITVGEQLLKQNALLLPDVYDSFTTKLKHIVQVRGIKLEGSDIANAVTPIWLRSQLSSLLDHHMAYRCCIKKYGTLLYRHGGDLVHALNVSLGQLRFQNRQSDHSNFDPVLEKTNVHDFQQTMSESCLKLTTFVMYVQGLHSSKKVVGVKQAA